MLHVTSDPRLETARVFRDPYLCIVPRILGALLWKSYIGDRHTARLAASTYSWVGTYTPRVNSQ
jgi:hypothetical protein